jgi:tetratricopeptide (TPR) repeat protein
MNRALRAAAALLLVAGCATPVQEGERRYREGDRRGALEIWRSVAPGDPDYAAAADRAASVQDEVAQLVVGYVENARALEEEGRLAESVLDYRLALALRPDDPVTLAHVQRLARELAHEKAAQIEAYQSVLEAGDLEAAAQALARLRELDPFEPEFEIEERQLQEAISAEWAQRQARYRQRLAGEVEGLVEAGRTAFREEKLETALDLWRRALLIDPDNERIQAYIARAERQLENLERLRQTQVGGAQP